MLPLTTSFSTTAAARKPLVRDARLENMAYVLRSSLYLHPSFARYVFQTPPSAPSHRLLPSTSGMLTLGTLRQAPHLQHCFQFTSSSSCMPASPPTILCATNCRCTSTSSSTSRRSARATRSGSRSRESSTSPLPAARTRVRFRLSKIILRFLF